VRNISRPRALVPTLKLVRFLPTFDVGTGVVLRDILPTNRGRETVRSHVSCMSMGLAAG
jgi:hypothetical protein